VLDWVGGNDRLAGRRVCTASGHAIVVAAWTILRFYVHQTDGNKTDQDGQPNSNFHMGHRLAVDERTILYLARYLRIVRLISVYRPKD
jgi:hypothetical protein